MIHYGVVDNNADLPDERGIYLFLVNGAVKYIGMSRNIKRRIICHNQRELLKKSRIMYVCLPDKSLYEIRQYERILQGKLYE